MKSNELKIISNGVQMKEIRPIEVDTKSEAAVDRQRRVDEVAAVLQGAETHK